MPYLPMELGADDPLDAAFPVVEQIRSTLTQATGVAASVKELLHPSLARKRKAAQAAAAAAAASQQTRAGVLSPGLLATGGILPYVVLGGVAFWFLLRKRR